MHRDPAPPTLDLSLLRGFAFRCQPECGLCCFTSPAVAPGERQRLLQIDPEAPVSVVKGGDATSHIASREGGGACYFLSEARCRCHPARPFPCRAFPLHVALNHRAQASVVLSCPGVDLGRLEEWRTDDGPEESPVGLEEELEAVRGELRSPDVAPRSGTTADAWGRSMRRALRSSRLSDPADLIARIVRHPPRPSDDDFPPAPLPDAQDPLELLPMYQERGVGIVAVRSQGSGCEALELQEGGGGGRSLGVFSVLDHPPSMEGSAIELLEGYLAYVVRRDHFLSSALWTWKQLKGEGFQEVVEQRLRELGAQLLARANLRAMLRGLVSSPMSAETVELGIRAVDMDELDRPSLGQLL
ncbi:MAG: YkgJ family cysteine cluster protein [Euryarchaeota archaeon]|nr:YkgJ family cysteine cluster protein [Euryarchaeota archaeon]MDE1835276.1 YkgJ family cysteine cluster protein [Euryarchaeota archaeon]MDE1881053.1 YkgJ family cysteine cluster protein [Euryarchaeota archaeon]MDE2043572.1 YkgJ family cysteine cluster protein [Thermoplasmata archaeon]